MPKSIKLKRRVPVKALEARLKIESNRRLRDRIQALQWVSDGVPVQEVARRIGRCRQSVSSFIHRFNQAGLPGLLRVGRGPGRRSRLNPRQWDTVVEWIRRGPRDLGYPFSNWDCKRLAICIRRTWKARLSDEQVRRQLHRMGCRLLRPKHELPGKDERDRSKKNEPSRFSWAAPSISNA
jgi:transposase